MFPLPEYLSPLIMNLLSKSGVALFYFFFQYILHYADTCVDIGPVKWALGNGSFLLSERFVYAHNDAHTSQPKP